MRLEAQRETDAGLWWVEGVVEVSGDGSEYESRVDGVWLDGERQWLSREEAQWAEEMLMDVREAFDAGQPWGLR